MLIWCAIEPTKIPIVTKIGTIPYFAMALIMKVLLKIMMTVRKRHAAHATTPAT